MDSRFDGCYHFAIKSGSVAIWHAVKPSVFKGFSGGWINSAYSHSIVPMGLGVRSRQTRLMPSTSWVMRSVILCSSA